MEKDNICILSKIDNSFKVKSGPVHIFDKTTSFDWHKLDTMMDTMCVNGGWDDLSRRFAAEKCCCISVCFPCGPDASFYGGRILR